MTERSVTESKTTKPLRRPWDRKHITNIVLVGGTSSGKSAVGLQLSRLLGFGFIDVDDLLEQRMGKSIAEIFQDQGEWGFREAEKHLIQSLEGITNHVIVAGAGAVENAENWENLKKLGKVIWLNTPLSEVVRRLAMSPDELRKRPLLGEAVNIEDKAEREKFVHRKLEDLMTRRWDFYKKADFIFENGYSTIETSAHLIANMLYLHSSPQ